MQKLPGSSFSFRQNSLDLVNGVLDHSGNRLDGKTFPSHAKNILISLIIFPLEVGTFLLIKYVNHSVSLHQENFISELRKRYIFYEITVKYAEYKFSHPLPRKQNDASAFAKASYCVECL